VRRAFLSGEKLHLRPLDESDLTEEYLGWLHDPEVTRYLETGRFPTTPEALRGYLRRFATGDDLAFAIVDNATDVHVGNVTLNHVSWVHRTADTGLMIGRREFWGRGFAFEAWSLLIEHAFERLNLRKIIAGVIADNVASFRVLQRLGFRQEGLLRAALFADGAYRDSLVLGMFREEFYKWAKPQ
jgi:[ribosomal protein S5]-alanine N-acetyltransferase